MRGDPFTPGGVFIDLRTIDGAGDKRRLVLERDGVKFKIDLNQTAIFGLLDECLDALVEMDGEHERCQMNCQGEDQGHRNGPHGADCDLIKTLVDGLRELRRRGT